MSDDLTDALLQGMPEEDPTFWSRMDDRLAAIEAGRGPSLATDPLDLPDETADQTADVIDIRFDAPAPAAQRARWALPALTAAAAAVVAFIIWGAVGQDPGGDRTTVTADAPDGVGTPSDNSSEPTGSDVLRDALARDVESLDAGFGEPFELTETDTGRRLSNTVNLIRDDPEILSFATMEGASLTISLTSIEETTVLRLVSPSGLLVLDVVAPHSSAIELDEAGEWSVVIEAVGRSDRFTLDLGLEEIG